MRIRVNESNQSIQLSALFGLAKIEVRDISFLVDEAMSNRPEWRNNLMLMSWLGELKLDRSPYPDRSMLNLPDTLQ
jgi:hypothetical protein